MHRKAYNKLPVPWRQIQNVRGTLRRGSFCLASVVDVAFLALKFEGNVLRQSPKLERCVNSTDSFLYQRVLGLVTSFLTAFLLSLNVELAGFVFVNVETVVFQAILYEK